MGQKTDRQKYPLKASSYTLLEEVGQGASAVVYRAKCIPLNEIVAIKVLDLERCNSNLDDIRREAQTMSLISHANVLSAYCSFVVEHSLWVVMPYMAGGSCLHIMKSAYPDGFEEPVIATFLKECLKALEYLHSHGHIHRDVKAGNILVDAGGPVKLGDFGVSACMFDTGDRQRLRNTFVGTPCWMAPEVLEQVHGYNIKADIWSFGITALELAHGHAPFSKYPPMKVLLMTLQNAPPGLDYERDKRFSKSFKEMIAMCLVKDPAKRPTAEKLLRHSFFKHSRSYDYIVRSVLDGLAPLGERFRDLKVKDAELLAQRKMAFGEKEERSQTEYKRGVSSWNFDVEDLKAQAALMEDDDGFPFGKVETEETDTSDELPRKNIVQDRGDEICSPDMRFHKAESYSDAGEHVKKGRSGPLAAPTAAQLNMSHNSKDSLAAYENGVHKDVSVVNANVKFQGQAVAPEVNKANEREDKGGKRNSDSSFRRLEERDWRLERMQHDGRRACSGPLVSEYVLAAYQNKDDEKGNDRHAFWLKDGATRERAHHRERPYSGPLSSYGVPFESRFNNEFAGGSRHSATKDGSDKSLFVQKKGRFSVTSTDIMLEALPRLSQPLDTELTPGNITTAAAVVTHLQSILHHTISQQVLITNLINDIGLGDCVNAQSICEFGSKLQCGTASRSASGSLVELSSDREHDLLQQVSDLQIRLTSLVDELQILKLRNASLEQQLNAIEEEERTRKEDEDKDETKSKSPEAAE